MKYWDVKFETMTLDAMREFQGAKLRETVQWLHDRVPFVQWLHDRVPFYRRKLDEKGVKPDDIRTIDDVRYLPFTVKNDLRDNYPFGLCAVPMKDLVRVHASSGTTGKPITGPYTADDLDQWSECMARTL